MCQDFTAKCHCLLVVLKRNQFKQEHMKVSEKTFPSLMSWCRNRELEFTTAAVFTLKTAFKCEVRSHIKKKTGSRVDSNRKTRQKARKDGWCEEGEEEKEEEEKEEGRTGRSGRGQVKRKW